MKENFLKKLLNLYYLPGSAHYILTGPMRGMVFRPSTVTGLMPLYSGPERWHQKRFKQFLKKGACLIDIGAGWGMHTLYTSRIVGENGKIIAIEPFPTAFKELEWHVARNSCRNVSVFNLAVSDTDGGESFFFNENLAVSKKNLEDAQFFKDRIEVRTKKVDTIVKELGLERVDFVKLDVEGAEGRVLKGAQETIERFRPFFLVDSHNPSTDLFIGEWFTRRGYKLQRVNPRLPPILKVDQGWPDNNGVWDSVLALP